MTVRSVGPAPAVKNPPLLAGLFLFSHRLSVKENRRDVIIKLKHRYGEPMVGDVGGFSSGCTCERPQGQSSKQFTPRMIAAKSIGGGRGGNRLCRYLPAAGWGGAGGLLLGLTKGFSIVIKDGREGEVKGEARFPPFSSSVFPTLVQFS